MFWLYLLGTWFGLWLLVRYLLLKTKVPDILCFAAFGLWVFYFWGGLPFYIIESFLKDSHPTPD